MLSPCELAMLVNFLSIAIAEGKSTSELNMLSVVFSQIGDTLATMAIQQLNIEEFCEKESSTYESEKGEKASSSVI